MVTRYAVYYTPPPDSALAEFGAAWMGWDAEAGAPRPHAEIAGLPVAALSAAPRRYGLHGTLKPPFRLAAGRDADALADAVGALARNLAPVDLGPLGLVRFGGVLALVPARHRSATTSLAAEVVETLDPFRAPPKAAELARRRATGLTQAQEALLAAWGYPYTHGEFRFHLTLSGPLPAPCAAAVAERLAPHLAPVLARPLMLDALTLLGESEDGFFRRIARVALRP